MLRVWRQSENVMDVYPVSERLFSKTLTFHLRFPWLLTYVGLWKTGSRCLAKAISDNYKVMSKIQHLLLLIIS